MSKTEENALTVEDYLDDLFEEAKASKPIMMKFVSKLRESLSEEVRGLGFSDSCEKTIRTAWAEVGLMNSLLSNKVKEARISDIIARTRHELSRQSYSNTMFLVTLDVPYIGMDDELCFSADMTCIVKANTEKEVISILKEELGPKDPEVQRALKYRDGFEGDEYFTAFLYKIPEDKRCVYIPDRTDPREADSKIKF